MEITKTKSGQMHIPELRRSLDTNRSKKLHQGWSKLIQESEIDFVLDAAEVSLTWVAQDCANCCSQPNACRILVQLSSATLALLFNRSSQ
jgi:hypothetical protein